MATLFLTSQQVFRASAFVAWVTPAAPGVNEATLASDPEPTIHMIDSNVTGIAKAARKMPITISLQIHDPKDGRNTLVTYRRGVDRMTPPCLASTHNFFTCRQKMRPSRK